MAGPPTELDPGQAEQLVQEIERYLSALAGAAGTIALAEGIVIVGPIVIAAAAVAFAFLGPYDHAAEVRKQALYIVWARARGLPYQVPDPVVLARVRQLERTTVHQEVTDVRALTARIKAQVANQRGTASSGNDAAVDVSPQQALTAQLVELDVLVARIATWRRGHHSLVHLPEVEAWTELYADLGAVETVLAQLADVNADAWHQLQGVALPRLRTRLETMVHGVQADLEQFRTRVTTQVVPHLQTQIDTSLERIRKLNTVTIPHLLELQDAETKARIKADAHLQRGVSEEADTRTSADLQLAGALAPLLAWAAGGGIHTTEKVQRNEDALNQLMNAPSALLGSLLSFGVYTALVGKVVERILPALPGALQGIEESAVRALGAL